MFPQLLVHSLGFRAGLDCLAFAAFHAFVHGGSSVLDSPAAAHAVCASGVAACSSSPLPAVT